MNQKNWPTHSEKEVEKILVDAGYKIEGNKIITQKERIYFGEIWKEIGWYEAIKICYTNSGVDLFSKKGVAILEEATKLKTFLESKKIRYRESPPRAIILKSIEKHKNFLEDIVKNLGEMEKKKTNRNIWKRGVYLP